MGRRKGAMNWSQENCPIDDHRLNLRGMGKGIEGIQNDCMCARVFAILCFRYLTLFHLQEKSFLFARRFSLWFCVRLHREALLIHFIHFFGSLCGPGRGDSPGLPPLFCEGDVCRKVFSMVSALWRSIAHTFYLRRFCGGPPKRILEASFFRFCRRA